MLRTTPAGLVGSACLLAADLAWALTVRPPALELLLPWFVALAAVGLFLPGVANQVTLSRAHLAGPALVYSVTPARLLELTVVVALAAVSDVLDGTVARRLGERSRLGGALDPVVDGVLFGAVATGLAVGGAYPAWLAVVVVARYAVPAVAGAMLLAAGRRPALQHTRGGQASTLVIAVLLCALALARALGWPTDILLSVAAVALPLGAVGAFANLLWANRGAIWPAGQKG